MSKKFLVLLLVLGFAGIAGAASVGVNFNDQGGSLGSTEWAGVVSQANWNNAGSNSGSASDLNDNRAAAMWWMRHGIAITLGILLVHKARLTQS